MKTHIETLNDAIKEAGGIRLVSEACGIRYETVRLWTKKGLPRTAWTGETDYVNKLCAMQRKYSKTRLLKRD